MPTITDITKQKKSDRIYNIIVDGKFAFGMSDLQISLMGLKIGQEISEDKIKQLQEEVDLQKAYHRGLHFLSFRARSEQELSDYLVKKGFASEFIIGAVDRLKQEKLIDDSAFAKSWLNNRLEFRHYPLARIRLELIHKGVSKDVIDRVMSELDSDAELESLQKLVLHKIKQTKYREPSKLMSYLTAKGYPYGQVKKVVDESLAGENSNF